MKKDLIMLGIVFVPLIIYNVVCWVNEIKRSKKTKKILKELGR